MGTSLNKHAELSDGKSILRSLRRSARVNPDRVFASVAEEQITYGRFIQDVDAVSTVLLSGGICDGAIIAMVLPNSIAWLQLFWAIVATGAKPLPLDPQIGKWELEQLCSVLPVAGFFAVEKYRANRPFENVNTLKENGGLKAFLVLVDGSADSIRVISSSGQTNGETGRVVTKFSSDDLLMFACTSGTTGNPRIISVPHAGFYQAQKDMAGYLALSENDVMLLGMPLYHQGGFGMGVQALLAGATIVYQEQFDPKAFLETVKHYGVTVIQLTPTLAKVLLSVPEFSPESLQSVRCVYFAGEALPDALAARFYDDMNIRVVNIIGSSETATMVVWDSDTDQGTGVNDFRPLPFTRMKVTDDSGMEVAVGETGVLRISTDAVLTEYAGNSKETREKISVTGSFRWFDTGDLCCRLDCGKVRFVGRKKRIIKRGANLLYPEEIETFLLTHPDIEAVAVVKEGHEIFGEAAVAYMQVRSGVCLKRGSVVSFCKGRIASYKIPDRMYFVNEIPKDIGKVQFKYLQPEKGVKR